MTSSNTDRTPSLDAEKGSATARRPWATPRVIASVDARHTQAKHLFNILDSHSPSGSSNSYS